MLALVGRHQAGPQQRAARRDGRDGSRRWCRRRRRRAPSRAGPPASRRRRSPGRPGWSPRVPSGSVPGSTTCEPEVREAPRAGTRRCRAARSNSCGPSERITRSAAERRADRGRDRRGAEDEGARGDPQVLDHVGRAGDEAAAGGEALGEGAHPQVDLVLEAEQLAGAGAARAEHARRRGPRRPSGGRRAPCRARRSRGRSQTSPSIEKTPSTTTRTPPPSSRGALEHPLELVHPVVAEGAQLGAGEPAAVEDRGVVAGVADHGVARLEDRPDAAQVRLVAGRVDDRLLGPHPLGQLALEVDVQRRRAVQQARAGDARCRRSRARRGRPA